MQNATRKGPPPSIGRLGACLLIAFCLLIPLQGQTAGPESQPIEVGFDKDYPPYEFTNPQNQPDGYTIDLMRAVSRVMGLNIQLRPGTWGDLRNDLASGRIQALTTMFKSPEREKQFNFCDPSLTVHYGLFARKSPAMPSRLEDLHRRKILVQRGSLLHEYLLKRGFQKTVVPVDSELDALRELAAGRQDAAVVAELTGLMLIRQGGIGNIQPVGKPLLSLELCFAVTPSDPVLRDRLNTGLAILRRTGEFDQIQEKWFGQLEGPDPHTLKRLRVLGTLAVALLAFLVCVLLWNRTLRRQILQRTRELQANQEFLQAVINSLPLMLFAKDPNQGFAFSLWNRKAEELTGSLAKDVLGTTDLDHFPPGQSQAFRKIDEEVMAQNEMRTIEEETLDTAKGQVLLRTFKVPIRDKAGKPLQLLGISEDITERRRIEQTLAQIQRLESLGVLAGGVAHDFNNYLMGIQGNLDLAVSELPAGHPARARLAAAMSSIRLSANLANQLLAYSGQGVYLIRPLSLNELITAMEDLLLSTISRKIEFHLKLDETLPMVQADERQMQQILLNLVINASEAIGDRSGILQISTFQEYLEASALPKRFPGQPVKPGLYAVLQVEDNGCGMEPEILSHLFEPFFSTKFTGRGLGLSAIQGILKSHKGAIQVSSQAKTGSTFRVFLPAVADHDQGPTLTE